MENKLLSIINHYGIEHQKRKLQEEVSELIEVITTHELKKSVEYEIPLTEIIGTREHILEELSDVMVVLEQIKLYYNLTSDEIRDVFWGKVDRTIERMK